uniref:Uncharacterized protein n=1 Tax=Glossina austeni TaxID=7395 RepID=A0A1A9VMS7_GLOAU
MFSKKLARLHKPRIDIANYTDGRYQQRLLRNHAQTKQKYKDVTENKLKIPAKSKSQESAKQIKRNEKEIASTSNRQDIKINQKKPVKTLKANKSKGKASARQQIQNNTKNTSKSRMECKGRPCQDGMTLKGNNYFEIAMFARRSKQNSHSKDGCEEFRKQSKAVCRGCLPNADRVHRCERQHAARTGRFTWRTTTTPAPEYRNDPFSYLNPDSWVHVADKAYREVFPFGKKIK